MKTLIIYDNEGYIIQQITGSYRTPVGIPYLEVDSTSYEGKIIKGVDITVTPNIPIFEDIPKTETELLQEKINEQEMAILELADIIGGMV